MSISYHNVQRYWPNSREPAGEEHRNSMNSGMKWEFRAQGLGVYKGVKDITRYNLGFPYKSYREVVGVHYVPMQANSLRRKPSLTCCSKPYLPLALLLPLLQVLHQPRA